MRLSRLFLPTEREDRSDAVVASHRLMIRAGMIRQLTAGVYSYLPLGLRVLRKVSQIVREEMDRAGAQEVLLPALQPADLWRESGRWDRFGPELIRLRDRNQREFCLGPTHEEVITDIIRKEVRSYRDLPLNLYQIQTKFRDERRPRFGVMRGREFTMKDAYSFDVSEEAAEESYGKMYDAYCRIFRRCGLDFRAVEAETGPIGGSFSHEFMVLADTGEDLLLTCNACDYAANQERAEVGRRDAAPLRDAPVHPMEKVSTPHMRSVDEVSTFLSVEPSQLIKTLLYVADGRPVALLVRGDRELNEAKARRSLGCESLELADEATIERVTGAPVGFAGPIGLKGQSNSGLKIIADHEISTMTDAVTGANEADAHLVHVAVGRDFQVDLFADIRNAVHGDPCPRCSEGSLELWRGIEVGHIFKLGTKYSEAMGALVQDESGRKVPIIMGCYGIGIDRTVAAAIEQHHDENGIIFPMSIAPYQVLVLCIQPEDPKVREAAERIYSHLNGERIEVLLDDRRESPGVKFKDADLIGVPLRINVGARGLQKGVVELRHRATGEVELHQPDHACKRVKEIIFDQT